MYTEHDRKNKKIGKTNKLALKVMSTILLATIVLIGLEVSGNNLFVLISVLILIIFSLAIFITGIKRILIARAAQQWPQVEAKIIECNIQQHIEPQKYSRLIYHYPELVVRYKYKDTEYQVNTYSLVRKDFRSLNRGKVEKTMENYQVGNVIHVYVSPENPEHSAIIPRMSKYQQSSCWGLIGSGILVTLLAIGAGVMGAL
jgi:hypothetical protein